MKTHTDIAAFLKRNPSGELNICWSEKNSRFEVIWMGRGRRSTTSKYLDDALENLSEQMRREASGTQLKEQKINPAYQWKNTVAAQVPAWATNTSGAHNQAAGMTVAICGTQTASTGVCPICSELPIYIDNVQYVACRSGHVWAIDTTHGIPYTFFGGHKARYDLNKGWQHVP